MALATWEIAIHSLNGGAIISDLTVQEWLVNWTLNGPGAFECTCTLDDVTETDLNPGRREIRVTRNGTLVWGGYLWAAQVDPVAYKVTFQGEGYFSRLRKRLVTSDLIYTDVSVQQIMWNLINHAQGKSNGNMGLTQGAHSGGSVLMDKAYCAADFPIIGEAIDELASMDDGADWVITPTPAISANKQFRTYQPRRGSGVGQTIDENDWKSLNYTIEGRSLVNWAQFLGPGDCNPIDWLEEDATSQSNNGLLEEAVEVELNSLRDVKAAAREYIRNYKNPMWQAQVEWWEGKGPTFGSFDIGDVITLESNKGYATFSKSMHVIGYEVQGFQTDAVFYSADLDSVVS